MYFCVGLMREESKRVRQRSFTYSSLTEDDRMLPSLINRVDKVSKLIHTTSEKVTFVNWSPWAKHLRDPHSITQSSRSPHVSPFGSPVIRRQHKAPKRSNNKGLDAASTRERLRAADTSKRDNYSVHPAGYLRRRSARPRYDPDWRRSRTTTFGSLCQLLICEVGLCNPILSYVQPGRGT